jgi:hypothetical protein
MAALANVDDPYLISALAEFLNDPAEEVRRAANEALLWDAAGRWPRIRLALRSALADSSRGADELILPVDQMLPPEAVKDLTGWAGESGVLSPRAARALSHHYARALVAQHDPNLGEELERHVSDPHYPAGLRIELAHLLEKRGLLESRILTKLLEPLNPAPLRLIAAESLLKEGTNVAAVNALRELAHLPNREIALGIAAVVQRHLGIDLGLALNQPRPPVQSRVAAEVTRRVMLWGAEADAASRRPAPEPVAT